MQCKLSPVHLSPPAPQQAEDIELVAAATRQRERRRRIVEESERQRQAEISPLNLKLTWRELRSAWRDSARTKQANRPRAGK